MNRTQSRWVFVAVAWILVSALGIPGVLAGDESDSAGRAAVWQTSYNSGDSAAVAALYSKDGARMPYQAPAVRGRAAIEKSIVATRDVGVATVKLVVVDAESMGDMGWSHGTYNLQSADGTTMQSGKWMNVSRKIDGQWLILADIWNTDEPDPVVAK